MVRVLQVCVGMRGRTWARLLREHPETTVVAYVDIRLAEVRQWLSASNDTAPCYDDLARALDETEPDAAVIVTPPVAHYEQVMAAFNRGLPVLVEKPLTETLDEAVALVHEAEKRNLALMVGMNFRYVPAHRRIREIIQNCELGRPSFAQFTYLRHRDGRRADLNKYAMTTAHPMLLEQAIHHFDLMRFCYGSEVVSVVADAWNPSWSTYDSPGNASVLLRFDDDLYVNYIGTYTAGWNKFDFRWRTDCDCGVLIQQAQFGSLYMARFIPEMGLDGERFKHEAEPLMSVIANEPSDFLENTRFLLNDFVDALQQGRPVASDGRDHLKSLALSLACIQAAESGERITMSDFYRQHNMQPA